MHYERCVLSRLLWCLLLILKHIRWYHRFRHLPRLFSFLWSSYCWYSKKHCKPVVQPRISDSWKESLILVHADIYWRILLCIHTLERMSISSVVIILSFASLYWYNTRNLDRLRFFTKATSGWDLTIPSRCCLLPPYFFLRTTLFGACSTRCKYWSICTCVNCTLHPGRRW